MNESIPGVGNLQPPASNSCVARPPKEKKVIWMNIMLMIFAGVVGADHDKITTLNKPLRLLANIIPIYVYITVHFMVGFLFLIMEQKNDIIPKSAFQTSFFLFLIS